jgi:RNA polymerase sigma-70 factor (ECF subfamily)
LFAATFTDSASAESLAAPLSEPSSQLEDIFQSYHGKVFAAAYRVTGSAHDAEDVLQTVFLRLLKRQDTLDLSPSPGAYLHRAAVNASLDLIRSKARSSSLPLDDLGGEPAEAESRSPERTQHDRELRRSLRLAITGLTPKSAEIFVLRFFEGQGNKDIADQLGMTQAAVGVALHRARNQVKEEIRSFVGEN